MFSDGSFRRSLWHYVRLQCAALALLLPVTARALTLNVPIGANPAALPGDRVVCGDVPAGWVVDATRKRVRPAADAKVGQTAIAAVAPQFSACGSKSEKVTFVATGNVPVIDVASVTLSLDAGRLELRGDGLEGVRVAWQAGKLAGSDVCLNVTKDKGRELCALNIDKALPADPRRIVLRFAAPGGHTDVDARSFDSMGNPLSDEQQQLPIARLLISRLFPESHTVDVASAEGHVRLLHPEAASSAECGVARCDLNEQGLVVRAVPAASTTITAKVRLLPRVFFSRGGVTDVMAAEQLTVLRCPLTIASGDPLRNVDDTSVLVKLDSACSKDLDQLRWSAAGDIAEVTRSETLPDGVYVLLSIGRITGEHLTIVASRHDDGSVLAVTRVRTREIPPLRTALTLPGFGEIEFIPNNRDALLSIAAIRGSGRVVPISVPGAYSVSEHKDGFHIRGVYTSGGYTALRFVYRVPTVPKPFADTNFASMMDPVQRPIREASVPAPLAASSTTQHPIVDLVCAVEGGRLKSIPAGSTIHIPFIARDSCRLILHRRRIPAEDGEQRLDINVSVVSVSGAVRPEATLIQPVVLRHGPDRDVIWIRGAEQQFDRINIRITHILDESLYMSGSTRVALPSAQWSVVTESANFKFYAAAAIPTSLYRFSNDPGDLGTGPLALNFGVLTRLTWLDSDGHEGLIGFEFGMMGMGLSADNDRQLAAVSGLGISIPLGNVHQSTQAAVNIHAWAAYSFGDREGRLTNEAGEFVRTVKLSPWAFVFGPSITIGSVGTFL